MIHKYQNILTSLQNQVNKKEERLLANAFLEGDFDYSVLATDLEKLYKDNYDGRIPNANLKAVVDIFHLLFKYLKQLKVYLINQE